MARRQGDRGGRTWTVVEALNTRGLKEKYAGAAGRAVSAAESNGAHAANSAMGNFSFAVAIIVGMFLLCMIILSVDEAYKFFTGMWVSK